MENVHGKLFQKTLSKSLASKWQLELAEIVFLFLLGMIAITLHARLRIPMQIPGKYGLIFMFIIVSGRMVSHYRFASSLSCLGASSLLFFNILGFNDPMMPIVYLLIGIIMDILFGLVEKSTYKFLLIILAGALAWSFIPIIRFSLGTLFSIPYHSMSKGLIYPIFTHFAAGFAGSLLATLVFIKSLK